MVCYFPERKPRGLKYSLKKETGKEYRYTVLIQVGGYLAPPPLLLQGLIFILKVSVLNTLNYTVECEQHKTGSFKKDSGSLLVG